MSPMQSTLSTALRVLNDSNIEHLLVGGLVVNHYGYANMEPIVDFMTVVNHPDMFVNAMKNAGFTSCSINPLVLFFKKPEPSIRVDFLRVNPETFAKLIRSAVTVTILGCQVKIPSLPDLLAMKFFSYGQSPMRRLKDLQDIVFLSFANKLDAEADLKPLALKYASEQIYQQVCTMLPQENNHDEE